MAPGSDKTQGQGSFGPFTGGLNLTPTGEPPTCGVSLRFTYVKYLDNANLVVVILPKKKFKRRTDRTPDPFY